MITAINQTQAIQNTLSRSQKKEATLNKQLSTGKKINSGSDDPTALGKISSLLSKFNEQEQSLSINNTTQSSLNVTSGSSMNALNNLQRLRELAVQAGDTTNSNLSETTNQAARDIQESINTSSSTSNLTTSSLGLDNLDFSSPEAITAIDNAISQVSSRLAEIGSQSNSLSAANEATQTSQENVASAKSNLEDVDLAKTIAETKENDIMKQMAIALMKSVQTSSKSALNQFL